MKKLILLAAAALISSHALAQEVTRVGAPTSPISSVVTVPANYDMVYVSGMVPPVVDKTAPAGSAAMYGGDTTAQTIGVIGRIEEALKGEGLGLGDIVMMRVYLVGDPTKGNLLDFAGMMKAYNQYFGTPTQPNKPSRVTVQVANLAGPGMLVEIEVQAAKKPAPMPMPKKKK